MKGYEGECRKCTMTGNGTRGNERVFVNSPFDA